MYRDHTKVIQIGDRKIGGGNPILIQSMTNTKTEDVEQTVAQILALEQAGCDIIRCAVPTMEAAKALKEIKKQIHIPLVADIHFDYRLAIAAMENGSKDRYFQENAKKLVPEGVEGRVAYKGHVEDTVFQLIGGLRSGMGYCGAKDIETLKATGRFVKITAASLKESHPHDIHITKEAPNYSVDDK